MKAPLRLNQNNSISGKMEKLKIDKSIEIDILDLGSLTINHNNLYPTQKDFYWKVEKNDFTVFNKSRQLGFTFISTGYLVLQAIIHGKKGAIVSPSLRQSQNAMSYTEMWIEYFQSKFKNVPKIIEQNKSKIKFDNGGEINALPNSASGIRGMPLDIVIFDEFAHFQHGTDKAIYTALLPATLKSQNFKIIVISTPFGELGEFYEMYHNREKYPDFIPTFYHYSQCGIDVSKYKRQLDYLSFQQEFEGVFLGDINTYFPFSIMRNCVNPELEYLTVDELQDLNVPLYVGIDIGRRRDFTAVSILADIKGKPRLVYKKVLKTLEEKQWDNQHKVFREILNNKNIVRTYIDFGFGKQLVETMQTEFRHVVPFTFTNDNKAQMFPMMRKRFETKMIELPDDPEILGSFHLIERTNVNNKIKFDSPKHTDEHGHADLSVSTILANYAYEREGNVGDVFRDNEGNPDYYQDIIRKRWKRQNSKFGRLI